MRSPTPALTPPGFQVSPREGVGQSVCNPESIAAPWDPVFLSEWDSLLSAVAAHLKNMGTYSALTAVRLTGINRTTSELRLPAEILITPCVENSVATWLKATPPVRAAPLLNAWDKLTSSFLKNFPDKFFGVEIIPTASGDMNLEYPFPAIDDKGCAYEPPWPTDPRDPNYVAGVCLNTAAVPDQNAPLLALASMKLPGRLSVSYQNLDLSGPANPYPPYAAETWGTTVGYQTNDYNNLQRAACSGGSANPGPCDSNSYLALLELGIYPLGKTNSLRAQYIEVLPPDAIAFPNAILQAHNELFPASQLTPLAHAADGNNFKTTFLLTNAGTSPAPYALQFNDAGGSTTPPRVPLELGSLTGTIPAGGSATVRTAGTGSFVGWAVLNAAPSVGGSVIYSQPSSPPSTTIQEGTTTLAGSGSQHFFVPFDNTQGAVTSMALTNSGTATANITVTLRYSDGTMETPAFPSLAGANHQSFAMPSQFPNTNGRSGVAEFVSSSPLYTVVFRFNTTHAFTALDVVPAGAFSSSITRTLAHAADGNGFKTTVLLTNTGTQPAPYTLQFNDAGGSNTPPQVLLELGSTAGMIPAGGSVTIRTAGTGSFVGWAELTAPASVGGSVIYSQPYLTTTQEGTATIVSTGSQHFFLPFDNTNGAITAMALTNSGTSAANLTVTLRYSDGTMETPSFPPLASRNHQSFAIPGQFPNSSNRSGVAEFVSSSPLYTVAFRFNTTHAFTAFGIVAQ